MSIFLSSILTFEAKTAYLATPPRHDKDGIFLDYYKNRTFRAILELNIPYQLGLS